MENEQKVATVRFPDGFSEVHDLGAGLRGYLSHVLIEVPDGRVFSVTFYDPVKLAQDCSLLSDPSEMCLAIPGMIVVETVSVANIQLAANYLLNQGYFDYLCPLSEEQLARANDWGWPP